MQEGRRLSAFPLFYMDKLFVTEIRFFNKCNYDQRHLHLEGIPKIINNYRMWAYALVATGLINWSYQRDQSGVVATSAFVIIPGLVLFAITFNKTLAGKLESKVARYFWGAVGALALIFTFIN